MGVKKWKKEAFVALEVKWCWLPVLSLNPLHCVCHCREYETTRVMQGNPIGEHDIRTCSQKGLWKRFSGHPGYPVACESCWVVSDSLWHHGLYSPCNPLGQNTRAGSHSVLQGIFPIQGANPGLPPCREILYHLNHQGSLVVHAIKPPKSTWCQITQSYILGSYVRI